jgi:hypothetical protein
MEGAGDMLTDIADSFVYIGADRYALVEVEGRMFFQGEEVMTLTDHDTHEIRYSSLIPPELLPRTLAVAVAEACHHRFAAPLLGNVD